MYINENLVIILNNQSQVTSWNKKHNLNIVLNEKIEIHWKYLKTKANFRKKSILIKCDECQTNFNKMIQNLDENLYFHLCKSCSKKGENNPMYEKKGEKHPKFGKKFESITGDKNPAKRQEVREKISNTNKGKIYRFNYKHTKETKEKIRKSNFGKKRSQDTINKIKEFRKTQIGDKSPYWKGGITKKINIMRNNKSYKDWRISVFNRDSYICKFCKTKKKQLEAHHIIGVYENLDLIYDINNGITLCKDCHKGFHIYFGKTNFINILMIISYD